VSEQGPGVFSRPAERDVDWFDRIPKVELHIHLEGAIPLDTLWTLVQKYGGDERVRTPAELARRFTYRDFPHFIETWIWKNGFLRELDDFTLIAEAVARDLAAQRVKYVEAFYSPADFSGHGLSTQTITEAIRTGLDRVPEVRVALIADLIRDLSPECGAATLAATTEVRSLGVIGIGIGGSEQRYPPEPWAALYETARASGLHTTAHAGEAAGPESIWGAIRALRVERIGHGTRAESDPALLDYLAHHGIPLEMCPISNVRTGVVPHLSAHPVKRYLDHGLIVTVNTDDPKMFNTSLAGEYRALTETFGLAREEVKRLVLTAAASCWLPPNEKEQLTSDLTTDPAWILP
jgi:adenosine deaminase